MSASKKIGITLENLQDSLCVIKVGNTYSAASMIGMARQLDLAETGERILCVSYGSGAGSDAFSFVVTDTPTNLHMLFTNYSTELISFQTITRPRHIENSKRIDDYFLFYSTNLLRLCQLVPYT